MRRLVNRYAAWVFDTEVDAFDGLIRGVVFIASLFAAVGVIGVGFVVLALRLHGDPPPSLFCANGSAVHATPTTHIVGRAPVEGVQYSCP